MAENVNIDILINTAASAKNVGDLRKSLEDLKKAQEDVKNASGETSDEFIKLDKAIKDTNKMIFDQAIAAANSATTMGELSKALKELKVQQEAVDQSSPEFQQLSDQINETEGRIGDLNDQFNTLTGSGLERANKSTGLFKEGLNNLDFGKVSIGLKGIAGSVDEFTKGVGKIKLGNLKSGFKELGDSGIGTLTKSFGQLAKAILTNPILLLAGIFVGIVAAVIQFRDKIKPIREIFDAIGKAVDVVVQKLKDFADWIGITDFAGEEAAENQKKRGKEVVDAETKKYDRMIKLAAAAGKETTDLEVKKQQVIMDGIKMQIDGIEKIRSINGKLTEEQIAELKELKDAYAEAETEKTAIALKAQTEANKLADEQKKKNDEEAKRKSDEAKKRAEEERKAREAADKALMKQIEDQNVAMIQDEETRAQEKLKLDYERSVKEIEQSKASDAVKAQALISAELSYLQEKDKITKEFDDKDEAKKKEKTEKEKTDRVKALQELSSLEQSQVEADIIKAGDNAIKIAQIKLDALKSEKENAILIAKANGEELDLINQEFANKELQLTKDLEKAKQEEAQKTLDKQIADRQATLQLGADTLNAFTNLYQGIYEMKKGELEKGSEAEKAAAKKNFEINKKMQIAAAVITGIQSVMAAFQNGMKNPIPLLGPATAAIYAGVAGIAAVANIAKIKATSFEAGGSIGGAAGGGGAPGGGAGGGGEAPKMQAANFYGLGQMKQGQQPQTQKVVVVESDITRAQTNVSKIETRATQTL
jgi:hypothetical protein